LVADHVVADVQHASDVLWFDDQLQSHLWPWDNSLRPRDLAAAKWAIGGQIILRDGQVASTDRRPDSRTMAAIDRQNHLFLAVAEDLSPRRFSERLAELGATDGILLKVAPPARWPWGGSLEVLPPEWFMEAGGQWPPILGFVPSRVRQVQ
jgi:hypothetical protein